MSIQCGNFLGATFSAKRQTWQMVRPPASAQINGTSKIFSVNLEIFCGMLFDHHSRHCLQQRFLTSTLPIAGIDPKHVNAQSTERDDGMNSTNERSSCMLHHKPFRRTSLVGAL
jgi:hypothetical protein